MVNLFFKEGFISVPGERREKKIPKKEGQERKTHSRERKREDESTESSVQITKRRRKSLGQTLSAFGIA